MIRFIPYPHHRETERKKVYKLNDPIGTLFINKRQDGTDWTDRGFMPLWNALHTTRWKQPELERSAASYCTEMYRSDDPFAIYTAIRLWDGYLRAREPRDRNQAAELLRLDIMGLISPLENYSSDELLDRSITDTIKKTDDEMKMDVWYPARTNLECVTAYRSFLPVIMYYHARLTDWSLYFRSCKVCGRVFLAKSQKYAMCSDKCRQKMKNTGKA